MEIERKFLVKQLPTQLNHYPSRTITQGYLNTDPVIRIRQDNENYELTYKSKGLLARQEYNLPLTAEAYGHLLAKIDGKLIQKTRYLIPLEQGLTAELDIFEGYLSPLTLVEVEFSSEEEAHAFTPPAWFGEDVTFSKEYHNSSLSQL